MYFITVVIEQQQPDYKRTLIEKPHVERFEKFGVMMLWAQGWFKTKGAMRTPYTQRRRLVYPKQYAFEDGGAWLNVFRQSDYSEFTEAKFLEGYNGAVENGMRIGLYKLPGRESEHTSYSYQPYGIPVVQVYQTKYHTYKYVVASLYACVTDALPEDKGVEQWLMS